MDGDETGLRELLLSALEGDEAAYRAFLTAAGARLRAFLRRRLSRTPDEVEDVLQEVLIAVHNQRHTYAPSEPLTPWLHAIARYKLVDCLRRLGRRELLHDPLEDGAELLAREDAAAHEARRDLAVLLGALPARQRGPIECVKLEGLSVAETAQRLRMSEPAVKVGVHRGLKALAARMRGTT